MFYTKGQVTVPKQMNFGKVPNHMCNETVGIITDESSTKTWPEQREISFFYRAGVY